MRTDKAPVLGFLAWVALATSVGIPALQASVSPLDELPSYIQRVTHFGQRADWSHDGKYIAFQFARLGDPAGVGRGLLIVDIEAYEEAKPAGH